MIASERLKGTWQVYAGVVPSAVEDKWTRNFPYSVDDYEKDMNLMKDNPGVDVDTMFAQQCRAAHQYAVEITDPGQVNWVNCIFVWF